MEKIGVTWEPQSRLKTDEKYHQKVALLSPKLWRHIKSWGEKLKQNIWKTSRRIYRFEPINSFSCCSYIQTFKAAAFLMICSLALRIFPKVSFSRVVPLGIWSILNSSSQWSCERGSPLTHFSTGSTFCVNYREVLYTIHIPQIHRLPSEKGEFKLNSK